MNIFNISDLASNNNGEYVLGSADLYTHACYLIYGILKSGEKDRVIKPGKGHEEIVCLVQGRVVLRSESETFDLWNGQAFHIKGNESYFMGGCSIIDRILSCHSEGQSPEESKRILKNKEILRGACPELDSSVAPLSQNDRKRRAQNDRLRQVKI